LKLMGIPDLLLVSRRIELYRPHAVSSCTVYHRQDDAASRKPATSVQEGTPQQLFDHLVGAQQQR